jgi:hypothetical protein
MRNQSCLAAYLGGLEHCSRCVPRQIDYKKGCYDAYLAGPLGIIALFFQ